MTCSFISASVVNSPCRAFWPQKLPGAPLTITERKGVGTLVFRTLLHPQFMTNPLRVLSRPRTATISVSFSESHLMPRKGCRDIIPGGANRQVCTAEVARSAAQILRSLCSLAVSIGQDKSFTEVKVMIHNETDRDTAIQTRINSQPWLQDKLGQLGVTEEHACSSHSVLLAITCGLAFI